MAKHHMTNFSSLASSESSMTLYGVEVEQDDGVLAQSEE